MNLSEIKQGIISPALKEIGLYSDTALNLVAGTGLVVSSTSLNSLGAGTIDGQQRRCSNCKLNGITGVEAYWHSSASKWTDSQNNDLTTN